VSKANKTIAIRTERYTCSECPGYCCSYRLIPVTERDVSRLAAHFGITPQAAETRFTKIIDGEVAMRTRRDRVYSNICMMFNQEKRCCSIYEARPEICRTYPGGRRCGYYDFLKFEREAQGDASFVPDA
jgi:Fe-S-cluster containining protein